MRILCLLLSLLATCASYKMVIIAPAMANSQVIFNKRVAEALADAGHDVTIALIYAFEGLESTIEKVKINENVNVYKVNATTGFTKQEMEQFQAETIFEDIPFYDSRMRDHMTMMMNMFRTSCQKTLQNQEFMNWLKNSNFDLAFVHMYHACPLGLAHAANIPWVWLNSGSLMDFVANTVGVPTIPSYVPPLMMASQDRMTFFERTKSFIGHSLMNYMWPRIVAKPETEIFRQELDPNFPDLIDIAANCSLVMVNSNPLYELPRPTLAKVVNIGGIGAQLKDTKPLPKDLEEVVQRGQGTVVMTFGSFAPIHKMPEEWKTALLGAFRRLPHLQFIVRYMGSDLDGRLPSNVHLMKWLPQSDLLQHPKIKAFISHGGYNGMQETIAAGKPIVMIPLFGDQPKNAKIAEKHGIARVLLKGDFNEDNIVAHVEAVTADPSYSAAARRLSAMVARQPVSAEVQLVRWAELLAEFKNLDNLSPAGQRLNFFQYHSLDVIAFLFSLVFLILFIVFALLRCVLRSIYRRICTKFCGKQKTKSD